jgi:hypothetical protein
MLNLPQVFFEAEGEGLGNGTSVASDETSAPGWMAQLPDEYKQDEGLMQFKTLGEFAKSYTTATTQLEGIETQPDEYSFEGVDYEIEEGVEFDLEAHHEQVAEFAKELGLTATQAKLLSQKVLAGEMDTLKESKTAQADAQAEAQAHYDACIEGLKTKWGGDYNANMTFMAKAAKAYWGEEFATAVDSVGLGNNQAFLEGLATIGKAMSEETLIQGDLPGKIEDEGPRDVASQADSIYGDTTPEKGVFHPDNVEIRSGQK